MNFIVLYVYVIMIFITGIGSFIVNKEFDSRYDILLSLIWPITYILLIVMGILNLFKKRKNLTTSDYPPFPSIYDDFDYPFTNRKGPYRKPFQFGRKFR